MSISRLQVLLRKTAWGCTNQEQPYLCAIDSPRQNLIQLYSESLNYFIYIFLTYLKYLTCSGQYLVTHKPTGRSFHSEQKQVR